MRTSYCAEESDLTVGASGQTRSTSTLATLLSPGAAPINEAKALGIAAALLIVAGEFTFRTRDAGLALSGAVDSQILVALAISALVAGVLLVRRVNTQLTGRRSGRAFLRLHPRSPIRVLRILAVTAIISSTWSPTSIALVRAIQLLIVVELMAEIVLTCRDDRAATAAFHATFARVLFVAVASAAALSFLTPVFHPWFPTYHGPSRLRLLSMHPVATANLLALVVLLMFWPLLNRWTAGTGQRKSRLTWLSGALGLLVVACMVLTRERASTVAGLLALLVLVLMNSNRRLSQLTMLAVVGVSVTAAEAFGAAFHLFATRGQSTTALATLSGRTEIFQEAVRLFWVHPYAGWGYLAGRSVFLPTIPWAGESHNVLVEIVVSAGIVGVVAYCVLFALWWSMVRTALQAGEVSRRLATLSVAIVTLVTVIGVGSDSYAGPPKLLVVVFGLALVQAELAYGFATYSMPSLEAIA